MIKLLKCLALGIFFPAACSTPQNLWEEMMMRDAGGRLYLSSSELENRGPYVRGPYGAHNLFDGNSATCWSEGAKSDGLGESVCVSIKEGTKSFILRNGYAKDLELFNSNNRIKNAEISIFTGINIPGEATETGVLFRALQYKKIKKIVLADTPAKQEIAFPFKWKSLIKFRNSELRSFKKINRKKLAAIKQEPRAVFILQLKILSVYKGNKYDDTCLTSLSFENITDDEHAVENQANIYVNESQNAILITDKNGKTETLVSDPKSIFQILEISPDKKWLIAIHMDANISHTRVETNYYLYNTELRKKIPSSYIANGVGELYGFDGSGEEIFLLYADNKEMTDKKIALSEIYNKLQ
ncbi:hypothetical protein KJ633_01350 [bacterium]|nr:hypothetical protein [bacterium]MBU3955085.1 hypothetical protein [bacterium]